MALVKPSGVRATTTKTGTGSYSSLVDVDSWRSFASITDNDTVYVCAIAGDGTFESFLATKSGGASPVLARTAIISNTEGTTDPIDWDTNTPLTIYTTLPGEKIPLLDAANTFTADQTISGTNKLKLGDGGQYVYSPVDGQLAIYADATSAAFENGNVKIYKSDDGASAGPTFELRRTSASLATSDALGNILFRATDSVGTMATFAQIYATVVDPTTSTHDGTLLFTVAENGSQNVRLGIKSDYPYLTCSTSGAVLIGKSINGTSLSGMEVSSLTGNTYITCGSGEALSINRSASDGTFVSFRRAGSEVGAITVTTGNITYGAFTGHHYSEWAPGEGGPEHETLGTVVCTADGMLDIECDPSPLARLARNAGDRAAYGVIACRQATSIGLPDGAPPRELLIVFGVGNGWIRVRGPVENGTLLWPSAEPGLAEAQPDQDQIGPWTIAKATQSSPDDGTVRLVPCTLMAG